MLSLERQVCGNLLLPVVNHSHGYGTVSAFRMTVRTSLHVRERARRVALGYFRCVLPIVQFCGVACAVPNSMVGWGREAPALCPTGAVRASRVSATPRLFKHVRLLLS